MTSQVLCNLVFSKLYNIIYKYIKRRTGRKKEVLKKEGRFFEERKKDGFIEGQRY
jgi:hypothetical protein